MGYTQRFNRTHHRVGHVFQGRYKAILVEKDSYLLEIPHAMLCSIPCGRAWWTTLGLGRGVAIPRP